MEAVEKTLTYRDDTGLYRKLLPEDKDKTDRKGHIETKSDESNYVELDNLVDMKSDGAKTVKVTFTGEGNQLSVIKCDTLRNEGHNGESKNISGDLAEEQSKDERDPGCGPVLGEPPRETPLKLPNTDLDSENGNQRQTELDPSDSEHVCSESEELQYTDMYLNSKTESDDGASAVLSDHYESDTVEDESHYITTHEIQLTELDHDVDYDLGRGTCWEFEDDNLVYSFVDYASFESDETHEGTLIVEGRSQAKVKAQSNIGGPVSTEQDESDLCDSDKCASSDESVCKNQTGDINAGQIHLSIKTSSRAVNEPGRILDKNTCSHTKLTGDRSRNFSFESSDAREGPLCDAARYFIPAPGRQHLATKLRRKDINEYSSGASSSISELDDADKEVRNLTAKSFRSLACPYFDAINLSTSSESSMSEYGLNKWSSYVDLNYGNGGRSVIAHKTSTATLEMNKAADSKNRHVESVISMKASQTKVDSLNKRMASSRLGTSSSKKIELKGPLQPKHGGVTLNFRCNVETPESAKFSKCAKNARSRDEVTGTMVAKSGCDIQYHGESVGDTHKRAIFASSLLKNVISKKMQFEHERKMERGEICDTYPALSPFKDQEVMKERSLGRGLQRQTSESGSGFSVNSADEQGLKGSRSSSCESTEGHRSTNALNDSCTSEKEQYEKRDSGEPQRGQLNRSQGSAFNSWKEDEPEPPKETEIPIAVSDAQPMKAKEGLDASMMTKLSQLFVPSSQLISKEKDLTEDLSSHTPATGTQKCEKEVNMGNNGNVAVKITPPKCGQVDLGKAKSHTNPTVTQGSSDSENYLTIPGLGYANEVKLLNPEQGMPRQAQRPEQSDQQRSPLIMEYPASTIYHHPAAVSTGPQTQQVLCFSPTVLTMSPAPSPGETMPQTQRKMLLDPTTGHYYLVDTPIQATTKRLFDPETGQYVDVPMPHSPVAPITPVPLSVSPLALSPGAYTPTYMICPGFIPSPTLPAQPVSPQTPCDKDAAGEQLKHAGRSLQETNTAGAESLYYSATREAAQVPLQLPVTLGHVSTRGSAASSERKPVISITTQQGPRIIAPPSFDGTTMSFVVEHR
ncbi:hypothetical protein LDENG_00112690 [Lucifuga dentata]|nr:hypothetical protein LDENG_00112690 [Lucifuga dentata]